LRGIFSNEDIIDHWSRAHSNISVHLDADKYGGVNPGDRRAIYYLIQALRPQRVLEIGTHIGASTAYISHALERGARLTTVDIADVNATNGPWRQLGLELSPAAVIDSLALPATVEFMTSSSLDYLRHSDEKFNFIFLDGDHASNTVYKEVSVALENLDEDGVILLHDYYPDRRALFPDGKVLYGPCLAMERISREQPDIRVVPLAQLPWTTRRGSHNTSLALLMRKRSG
jgi:predicted O-methyltransferase YrrM